MTRRAAVNSGTTPGKLSPLPADLDSGRSASVWVLALLTCVGLSACAVRAEPSSGVDASPEEVVEALFAAIDVGDASGAAALFDEATVDAFQRGLHVQVAHFRARNIPHEAAPMPGVLTHAEIEQLPSLEIPERYLVTLTPQYRRERSLSDHGAETTSWRHPRGVLGHVLEGDTLAHVPYSREAFLDGVPMQPDPVRVITLVRRPEAWRIVEGELDNVGPGFFTTILLTPHLLSAPYDP